MIITGTKRPGGEGAGAQAECIYGAHPLSRSTAVSLVPVFSAKGAPVEEIRSSVESLLSAEIRILEDFSFPGTLGSRQVRAATQFSAVSCIEHLSLLRKGDGSVVGIVDVDLYYPGLNHVYGLSAPVQQTSVVSVARLGYEGRGEAVREKVLERTVKTVLHELGHLYGLAHCKDPQCVMFLSFNLTDTDYKGSEFCLRCKETYNKNKERRL